MQIIRKGLLVLLALGLIACTGIFLFFQTFDSDQYLPQITQKASLALGRPVSVGSVGLGLSLQGITLDAGDVIIGDDPGFTKQPFIKVEKVRLSLDLMSLILRREIHITEILLQSPQFHLIRSFEGEFNSHSLGHESQADLNGNSPAVSNGNWNGTPKISSKQHLLVGDTTVNLIKIRDASVSYIDQNQTFPLDIWLTNINADLTGFSLSKPFQLSFDASLYNDAPNVHGIAVVSLQAGQGPSGRSIQISDLRLETDLSQISFEGLKRISPQMQGVLFMKNIAGKVQLNLADLEIAPPVGIKADGSLTVTGGVIKDFNIIKMVLSHTLGVFGGIQVNIDNLFNGQLRDKLGAADTVINKAEAKFAFHDKTIFIDDASIETNIFAFTAKGSVDGGLNMDMQTMLRLNNDVSAALVSELDGFKLLYDDSNRIAIGASLKGVIPHLQYKPNKDFRKKSKRALMQEGGNILGILLGGGPLSVQGQVTPGQGQGTRSKKRFKNILKGLLQ